MVTTGWNKLSDGKVMEETYDVLKYEKGKKIEMKDIIEGIWMETGELELVLNGNGQNKILAKING